MSGDAATIEKWLDEQPDVEEIFTAPSYDELASFLERHLNPEGDSSVTAEEKAPSTDDDEKEAAAVVAPTEAKAPVVEEDDDEVSSDSGDVAEEFEKLFNS